MKLRHMYERLDPDVFVPPAERTMSFLKEHSEGVLATVDPNGNPHAAVIYYAIGKDFAVTFLTKRNTKKSDNLVHHNHAMLVVFDGGAQTTVQITGVAAEVKGPTEVNQAFRNTLRASLHGGRTAIPPIVKLHAGEFVVYCLKPVQVRLTTYAPSVLSAPGQMAEVFDIPL